MVCKIIKKTPTKSIKDVKRHCYRRSPLKNNPVLTAINKSILTCQRRLIKLFSKLARLSTPNHNRKKGYKILKKLPNEDHDDHVRRSISFDIPLPPNGSDKKTIILDLDETLVHSQPDPPPARFDFVVRPKIEGEIMTLYVIKRPGVDELLESLSRKFEIVVFTAGMKEYASLVLDILDPMAWISHRLYRDSCKEMNGKMVKDLAEIGRDLKSVVIVDDNPNAYLLQPENAIPICPFIDDLDDKELLRLMKFFQGCDGSEDLRETIKQYLWEREQKLEL